MAELFERAGYAVVPFDQAADVYVVNTCTVTMRSDYRSRQMLRRAFRRGRGALVVATGCYAEREPEALAGLPEVDIVVGNSAKGRILDVVSGHRAACAEQLPEHGADESYTDEPSLCNAGNGRPGSRRTRIVTGAAGASFEPLDISRFRDHTRAFIKIQDGCDRRCSYCAVPDARGRARSRPFDDVLAQARRLARNGYREVVLTGVHIGSYGSDLGGCGLHDLLPALARIDGLERIRLGSIEPNELGSDLASAIASIDRVCNHLHVPLESGSDRILARMRRDYTGAQYAEAVRRVVDEDPLCGLGADVMVGFPGETDEDFAKTVELIELLPFTYLHVFSYSPRKNTEAAGMEGQVPHTEKKRRSRTLRALATRKSLAFRSSLIGTRLELLVEHGGRSSADGVLSGISSNYVRVDFEGGSFLANRFVQTEVLGADEAGTWGTVTAGTAR
jgi:threonylcarbamoyladenosine tRNA methylthiotransferase MtaB